jgi:hypothetical protein
MLPDFIASLRVSLPSEDRGNIIVPGTKLSAEPMV